MELTPADKKIMINTLKTLHLNNVDELIRNIAVAKMDSQLMFINLRW